MVLGIKNPFKKDDGELEYTRGLVQAEVAGDAGKPPASPEMEAWNLETKMKFMIKDEDVSNFLLQNKCLQPLVPVFSPVNATIKLGKQQEALKRIRIENMITLMKLTMSPRTYEARGLEVLEGLRLYGHDRVSEAAEGWKGHLVTEQVKVIETRTEKKGWFHRG